MLIKNSPQINWYNCVIDKKIVGLHKSIFTDKHDIYVNKKIFFAHIVHNTMDFKHNFLRNQKIRWYIVIFGVLWISFTVYYDLIKDESVFKFIFYFIIGLIVISRGLGVPFEKLFGKKYIYVSEKKLSIKLKVLKKGIEIRWDEIALLELWPGKIIITTQKAGIHSADITEIAPQVRHDFLQTIIRIAEQKEIDTKKHGYLINV